jgi:hypothetical protein
MSQRNPSKITSDLEVDDALVQNAGFEFGKNDRQFLDNQIRGLQQHLVDALIRGRHATYLRVDASSASLIAGDVVCLSLAQVEPRVTKCTADTLTDAVAAFGVVVLAAAPGAFALIAYGGALPPAITGLSPNNAGFVRVNTSTGRCERVATLGGGDYGIGIVAKSGNMIVVPGAIGVSGGGGATPGGSDGDLQRNATGTLAPVRTAANATPATGDIVRYDGAKAIWTPDSAELPVGITAGDLLYWNGSALARIPIGTPGQVLTVSGGGLPAWVGAAFNRATLTLTGWWKGSYGGSPWVGSASAGTSGSRNLTEATNPPAAGAAQNGLTPADFDGTNDKLSNALTLDNFITNSAGSVWILFRPDTAGTAAAAFSKHTQRGLLAQDGGSTTFSVTHSTAGVALSIYDTSQKEIEIACGIGAYHLAQVRWGGGNAELRVDNGLWSTTACTGMTGTAGALVVGRNFFNQFFDGRILEVGIAASRLDDATFNNIKSAINSDFALSL